MVGIVVEILGSYAVGLNRERTRVSMAVTASARAVEKKFDRRIEAHTQAGFGEMRPNGRISKVWDSQTFPGKPGKHSLEPAIYLSVDSRYQDIIQAFDDGAQISAPGGNWLIVPTPMAIKAGLYPDNKTKRDASSRFKAGRVGRNWMSAAERKFGWLVFVPSRRGGGWLFARSKKKRKQYPFPVFRVVKRVRLKKRLDYQGQFSLFRRDFTKSLLSELETHL